MVERWRERETSPSEHQNTLCFFSGVFLLHLCSHKQIFSLQRVFFCCSGAQGRHKVQQTISLLHQTHGEIQRFPVLGTFLVILHKSTFPALQRTRKKEVLRWGLKWFVSTGAPKPDWQMSRGAFELKILPDVAKESKKRFPGVVWVWEKTPQQVCICTKPITSTKPVFPCVMCRKQNQIKVLTPIFQGFNAAKSMWLAEQYRSFIMSNCFLIMAAW